MRCKRDNMIFDDPTLTRLLGSIEANRLVLLEVERKKANSLLASHRAVLKLGDEFYAIHPDGVRFLGNPMGIHRLSVPLSRSSMIGEDSFSYISRLFPTG